MRYLITTTVFLIFTGCGGGGAAGGSRDLNTTAAPQPEKIENRAPVLLYSETLMVPEGVTTVAVIAASDEDNDSLTFSIASGDDQHMFNIDESTGALAFLIPPDFESPEDSGSDNVYEVTVQVSDGVLSDSQSLSITVSDTLAFEETSLVVNATVEALQSVCPGDEVQQQFVLPVDLNGDSLIDSLPITGVRGQTSRSLTMVQHRTYLLLTFQIATVHTMQRMKLYLVTLTQNLAVLPGRLILEI